MEIKRAIGSSELEATTGDCKLKALISTVSYCIIGILELSLDNDNPAQFLEAVITSLPFEQITTPQREYRFFEAS